MTKRLALYTAVLPMCILGLSACDNIVVTPEERAALEAADAAEAQKLAAEAIESAQPEEIANEPAIAQIDPDPDALPEAVQAKLDEIKATLGTKSLRRLVRLAQKNDDFRSNYGGISHWEHWYLMKRAGIDPVEKTQEILAQPYGVKDFGNEKYYIWPDFAARSKEELEMGRLTFRERADMMKLIGQDGLSRLEAGDSYPGFRLAITQEGEWVYLLQG